MFEWNPISTDEFTNAKGEKTTVKLICPLQKTAGNYFVATEGRELDLIAFQELGSEYESLNLLQNNAQAIVEYGFDMSKVKNVFIP